MELRKDCCIDETLDDASTQHTHTHTLDFSRLVLCADAAAVSLEMDVIYATFMMCERAV